MLIRTIQYFKCNSIELLTQVTQMLKNAFVIFFYLLKYIRLIFFQIQSQFSVKCIA